MTPLTIALSATLAATLPPLGAPRPPVLDLSSLVPEEDPVARDGAALCADLPFGEHGVAAAIVIYGRRPGRSAWGHISLRVVGCRDGALRDVEFEATRLDGASIAWFQRLYPDEDWYSGPDFRRRERDRLILFRNEDPVDSGVYAQELMKNREIIEAWLPWTADETTAVLRTLDVEYAEQMANFRASQASDRPRYRAMSVNCTAPIQAALAAQSPDLVSHPSAYPLHWLRQLETIDGVQLVVHASPHVLASLQEAEGDLKRAHSGASTTIPRPLVRRRLDHAQLRAFQRRIASTAWSVPMVWTTEQQALADR